MEGKEEVSEECETENVKEHDEHLQQTGKKTRASFKPST